jgi:transcriptional regulator with XRE-family HTH domain
MTIEDVRKSFVNNLKKLMIEHNKTQTDIAQIAGVSQGTVSDWLTGKKYPRMDKIQKIVDYFGLPVTALVNDGKGVSYYLNPETARLAQEAANDPETRLLLDAKRDLSPEDMQYVISLIKHLKNKNS